MTWTRTASPTCTASSAWLRRLPAIFDSSEMWSRPSVPGVSDTNAPKSTVLTTRALYFSPFSGSTGLAMALTRSRASCATSLEFA